MVIRFPDDLTNMNWKEVVELWIRKFSTVAPSKIYSNLKTHHAAPIPYFLIITFVEDNKDATKTNLDIVKIASIDVVSLIFDCQKQYYTFSNA